MVDADNKIERFFGNNLGGSALWQMLLDAGRSNEEIKELVEFQIAEERELYEFMGGRELVESIDPKWREAVIAISAVRLVVEKEGCWKPKVYKAPIKEPVEDTGPVRYGRREELR